MISSTSVTHIKRHLYLYGDLGGPDEIEEEVSQWDSEWDLPNEEVILHINSPGGSVDSMLSIMNRLSRIRNLSTINEGISFSAGLFLFLLGKRRAAVPNSLFMAHNFLLSFSRELDMPITNLNEYSKQMAIMGSNLLTEHLFKTKYVSKVEFGDIISGKEIYIDYNSAVSRGIINCELALLQ